MDAIRIHEKINSIVPIIGTSFESLSDKSSWKIDYKNEPTTEQLLQIQTFIDEYEIMTKKEIEDNKTNRFYLQNTDWQIIRHLEEMAIGGETTLSGAEFIDLSTKRHDARNKIVDKTKEIDKQK